MKRQLQFLYRYLFSSRRWRRWISGQTLAVVVGSIVLFALLTWTAPRAQPRILPTPTPGGSLTLTPLATPLPAEYVYNAQQTVGITFAAAVLVLIVVIGVATFLPRKSE